MCRALTSLVHRGATLSDAARMIDEPAVAGASGKS